MKGGCCHLLTFISYPVTLTPAAILQRVLSASVTVEKELVSSIGKGVLVFAAVAPGDTEKDVDSLAAKIVNMRLWDDDEGGKVCRHSGCHGYLLVTDIDSGRRTSKISAARFFVVSTEPMANKQGFDPLLTA